MEGTPFLRGRGLFRSPVDEEKRRQQQEYANELRKQAEEARLRKLQAQQQTNGGHWEGRSSGKILNANSPPNGTHSPPPLSMAATSPSIAKSFSPPEPDAAHYTQLKLQSTPPPQEVHQVRTELLADSRMFQLVQQLSQRLEDLEQRQLHIPEFVRGNDASGNGSSYDSLLHKLAAKIDAVHGEVGRLANQCNARFGVLELHQQESDKSTDSALAELRNDMLGRLERHSGKAADLLATIDERLKRRDDELRRLDRKIDELTKELDSMRKDFVESKAQDNEFKHLVNEHIRAERLDHDRGDRLAQELATQRDLLEILKREADDRIGNLENVLRSEIKHRLKNEDAIRNDIGALFRELRAIPLPPMPGYYLPAPSPPTPQVALNNFPPANGAVDLVDAKKTPPPIQEQRPLTRRIHPDTPSRPSSANALSTQLAGLVQFIEDLAAEVDLTRKEVYKWSVKTSEAVRQGKRTARSVRNMKVAIVDALEKNIFAAEEDEDEDTGSTAPPPKHTALAGSLKPIKQALLRSASQEQLKAKDLSTTNHEKTQHRADKEPVNLPPITLKERAPSRPRSPKAGERKTSRASTPSHNKANEAPAEAHITKAPESRPPSRRSASRGSMSASLATEGGFSNPSSEETSSTKSQVNSPRTYSSAPIISSSPRPPSTHGLAAVQQPSEMKFDFEGAGEIGGEEHYPQDFENDEGQ